MARASATILYLQTIVVIADVYINTPHIYR